MRRQHIIDARKAAKLSQAQAAQLLGMSQQAYQKYESGKTRIDAPVAKRIAAVLRCDPGFILTEGSGLTKVAIVGVINSAERIEALSDGDVEVREVLVPPGVLPEDLRLVRVDTDALAPRFIKGDLVIFSRDFIDHVSGECVVCLPDNTLRIARIEPGSQPGTFTLRPYQAGLPLLQNQRLRWAAKVRSIWLG